MNAPMLDSNIPLLTEVIEPPAAAESAPLPVPAEPIEPAGVPAIAEPEPAATVTAPEPTGIETDWNALERDISLRVLEQLQGRIDFVLGHRVRDNLADVLQTAIESLTAEIRQGLQNTLEEVVTRAVAQEITHIRSSRK